jgi:hypothetical protein
MILDRGDTPEEVVYTATSPSASGRRDVVEVFHEEEQDPEAYPEPRDPAEPGREPDAAR